MRLDVEAVEDRRAAMVQLAHKGGRRGVIARLEANVLIQIGEHLAHEEERPAIVEPPFWREST